jgi:hypothetical protein
MSFQSRTNGAARAIGAVVLLGTALAACSDIYYDRRETISLGAKDAVAANMAEQTIDPWPRQSGNTNLAFNGEKMQSAQERYRQNQVYPPVNATTSSAAYQALQPQAAPTTSGNNNISAPAAPTK